jgi:nucleoside-diphosphate-sugar epimerase
MSSIVTRGAGFLGSHLVDALTRRGESVIALDNLTTGRLANLESAISSGRVTFVYSDVTHDAESLNEIVAGSGAKRVSAIYHLASPEGSDSASERPSEALAVDDESGLTALIELAIAHRAKLIVSSNAASSGDSLAPSVSEDFTGNGEPIGQRERHDGGKSFGEAAVSAAVAKHGLDARIVRFFHCYGPRMQDADEDVLSSFFKAAANRDPFPIHGTGDQVRSMTFVRDAIDLLVMIADRGDKSLTTIDIGNDDRRSALDIAKTLARVLRRDFVAEYVPVPARERQHDLPDLTHARALGWAPSTSLDYGLQVTYNWFTQQSQLFV